MRGRSKPALLALLASVSIVAWAGEVQKALELNVTESVEVANQSAAAMVGLFECDSGSNVFFMPPGGNGLPDTVVRISSDGSKKTPFRLGAVPEFQKSAILAYAVGLDDHIYILTAKPDGDSFVVGFDKEGQLGSVTKLEVPKGAFLRRIAVSSEGSYFVGGSQQEGENLVRKPLDALFNAHGQMIATVNLMKRQTAAPNLKASDMPRLSPDQMAKAQSLQARVDLSIVRTGADGNFYFSAFDPRGPVLVVSPSGEVERQFDLIPPKEAGFELLDLKLSNGRLAVAYQGEPPPGGTAPVRIDVYDIQTGAKLVSYYHENWRIGVAWACYTPDKFTFISADEQGKMRLVTASAR